MPRLISDLRPTRRIRAVLRVLLDEPVREHIGVELATASGLTGGRVHPVLARLDRAGWVLSRWGGPDANEGPRTRYYRLRPDAVALARKVVFPHEAVSREPAVNLHRSLAGRRA